MHIIYRKKTNPSYQLCWSCYYGKWNSSNEWDGNFDSAAYSSIRTRESFTCSQCQGYIVDEEELYRRRYKRQHHSWGKSKYKPDTRRHNAAGKLIGGHHGHQWGWSLHQGKEWKRLLHQSERRYWVRYAREILADPVHEPYVSMGSFVHLSREVNWKLW